MALASIFTNGIMKYPDETFPTVGFGIVFLLSNILFNILSAMMKYKGNTMRLRIIQPIFITIITLIAFVSPRISTVLFMLLPLSWWLITSLSSQKEENNTPKTI